jgi:hypothetical protein
MPQGLFTIVGGAIVMAFTSGLFWFCLPRGGKTHRFVDTELEPYIGVAFCAGFALAFTMLLSGALEYMGTR